VRSNYRTARVKSAVEAFHRGEHSLDHCLQDRIAVSGTNYEISCRTLDLMVEIAVAHRADWARMTAGDLGGCTSIW